jgi:hypothetical protein
LYVFTGPLQSVATTYQLAAYHQDLPQRRSPAGELREEVGGEAAELRFAGQFYTSKGISNEGAYVSRSAGVACPD